MIGNPIRPAQAEPGHGGQASFAMSPKASTRLLATQSDERLAALVRAGHDRAFEALVLRHRAPLLRYCRRVPLSETRAEDVVQQALMQAWTALRRGAEVRDLRAWLYRIVHNTAIDVVRGAAREGRQIAADSEGSAEAASGRAATGDADLERGLAAREALVSIAALPQMQREVVFRTAIAGYSHEEVASALGLSDGAVRGLLYRARVALRATITALTPPPLLSWMAGAGQGAAGERIGELAAGGGSIGLGGLLVKGGVLALTAGTLLTGAVIVHPSARHHTPRGASATSGEVSSTAAPHSRGSALQWTPPRAFSGGSSSATASQRLSTGGSHRHLSSAGARTVRGWGLGGTLPSADARSPRFGSPPKGPRPPSVPGPTEGSGGGSGQSAPAGQAPAPTTGASGSGEGSPNGPAGSPGGGSAGGGSAGGGSGSGAEGTGSGGSGTGSGGAGTGGSGGSTGSGSGGSSGSGSSPTPPPSGSGSGGSGSGSSGGGSGGSGGSSGSGGPVTTVVHEVTNLLESTVHGVLGGH